MKSSSELLKEIRSRFPGASEKADREFSIRFGQVDDEHYNYTWFECLANAINGDMRRKVLAEVHIELLNAIESGFLVGDDYLKKCIDVAFAENLFWQVTPGQAKPYWDLMPKSIKKLYIDFHRCEPL